MLQTKCNEYNVICFNNREPLSIFKKLFENILFNNEAARNRCVEYSADICADVSSDVPSDAESGNNISDGGSEVDFTRNRSTLVLCECCSRLAKNMTKTFMYLTYLQCV